MCGRYYLDLDQVNFASFGGETGRRDIRPSEQAPVVSRQAGQDRAGLMTWGFENERGGRIINARSESMREKPTFRSLVDRGRCAIPASGYYEWRRGDRQQFNVSRRDGALFYLAGLYRIGRRGPEFVVLTQPPVPGIARFHDRMPLLLPDGAAMARWLSGADERFDDEPLLSIAAQGDEQLRMF